MKITCEHRAMLTAWATTDLSPREIAADLGVTKGVVSGVTFRYASYIGVSGRHAFRVAYDNAKRRMEAGMDAQLTIWDVLERGSVPFPSKPKPPRQSGERVAPKPSVAPLPKAKPEPQPVPIDLWVEPELPLGAPDPAPPRSIMSLRFGTCRAVVGEHPDMEGGLYCCEPTTTKSFCKAHHELYYEPKQRPARGEAKQVFLHKMKFKAA